jgi:polysaccharide biosynthesis protein VpsM
MSRNCVIGAKTTVKTLARRGVGATNTRGRMNILLAKVLWAPLLVIFFCVPSAWAEDSDTRGFEYGLDSQIRYDDNIYRANTGEVDSWILRVAPFIRGTLFNDGNTYQLEYQLKHNEYFDSSDDTYTDHVLMMDINHRFTHRQAIVLAAGYRWLTEERGTGFSEEPNSIVDGPDDYERLNLEARYLLGVPTATLRFELYGKHYELDFDSSYVFNTRDYEENQLGIIGRYRIGARTDFLLEYRRQMLEYDNTPLDLTGSSLNLDADEDYFLVGLEWEMTAKTKGEVKLGHSSRDYDQENYSTSDFHWEANLEWRPKTYSRFIFKTQRYSQETFGSGLYINSQRYHLAWVHSWPGPWRSEVKGGFIEDNYEDSGRQDDRFYWEAFIAYDYATWMALELGFKHTDNDSNIDPIDYLQNILYLRAMVEF